MTSDDEAVTPPAPDSTLAAIETALRRIDAALADTQTVRALIDTLARQRDSYGRGFQLLAEQNDAYERLINDDDTLMTHEDHITILRDAMHALKRDGRLVARLDALERRLDEEAQTDDFASDVAYATALWAEFQRLKGSA